MTPTPEERIEALEKRIAELEQFIKLQLTVNDLVFARLNNHNRVIFSKISPSVLDEGITNEQTNQTKQ